MTKTIKINERNQNETDSSTSEQKGDDQPEHKKFKHKTLI